MWGTNRVSEWWGHSKRFLCRRIGTRHIANRFNNLVIVSELWLSICDGHKHPSRIHLRPNLHVCDLRDSQFGACRGPWRDNHNRSIWPNHDVDFTGLAEHLHNICDLRIELKSDFRLIIIGYRPVDSRLWSTIENDSPLNNADTSLWIFPRHCNI